MSTLPWLLAGAMLGVLATVLLGWLVWRHTQAASARATHAELQAIGQLLDVWQWRTDAQHRLVRWAPPRGAPSSAWSGSSPAMQAWDRLDAQGTLRLRERMHEHAPLTDLPLVQIGAGAAAPRWRVRGLPLLDGDGRFAGYTGTARCVDVELAQQDGLRCLQSVLDARDAPTLIVGGPPAPGLRHANAAAAALLGLSSDAPPGQALDELLGRGPEGLRTAVNATLAGRTATFGDWTLAATDVAAGGDGAQPLRLVCFSRSATPADGAAQAEAEAFGYTVSHDLRAPLRVVEGFGRILKEDYAAVLDRMGNDHLDRILAAAARMNQMIDALLALAHLSRQPLVRQRVDLSQLARYVVDDLRRAAPERVVDVEIEPDLSVQADPTLLRLVLENLIGNAWKYSEKTPLAQIGFHAHDWQGRRVFVVGDNGAGFDMRFADRLFRMFQRLHSASDFAGTGVGLASVKRIVQRHGGDVWAESEVGRGARFHFTLGP